MASLREIGQTLKEAREAQGISLEDLAARTRVTTRHLMAVEEGNEGALPEVFYVRGFIKKYAEAVGLNPTEMADAYRSAPIPQPTAAGPRISVGPIAYYLVIALLIGGALALAWHFQPRVSVVAESPSPSPAPTATPHATPAPVAAATGASEVAPVTAPASAKPSASPLAAVASPTASPLASPSVAPSASPSVRPSAKPSPKPVAKPTPKPTATPSEAPVETPQPMPTARPAATGPQKQVTLFVQERAWVEVIVDGQVAFEGLMLPGNTRRFTGGTVEITAGNAGGVRVSVDNKDRGLLGERGVVVTRTF